jgi:hypothetical protein
MPKLKPQVKFVPFGIASRVGNTIYINKELPKFKYALYESILAHECKHGEGYSFSDIKLDIVNKELEGMKGDYYKFILSHPSTLTELLPIWRYEGFWQINPTLCGFYMAVFILGGAIWLLT